MTIKRVRFLQELLSLMGLEERLHLEWISSAEAQKFADTITSFTEKIQLLGKNPLINPLTSSQAEIALSAMEKEVTAS